MIQVMMMLVVKMMTIMIVITMIQALIFKFTELQQTGGKVDRGSEEFHAIKELAKRFALSFGLDALKNREAVTGLHREVRVMIVKVMIYWQ